MKIYLYFLVFLMFLTSVFAIGNTLVVDLTKVALNSVTLGVKDRMSFNLLGGEHTIIIDKIHDKGVDLDIFPFVDKKEPVSYITLKYDRHIKVDLDRDNSDDLNIRLLNINGDEVTIMVENLNFDPDSVPVNGKDRDVNLLLIMGIITGLFLLVLLVYLFYKK